MWKICVFISAILLCSCMVGPNYKAPRQNIAEQWLIASHSKSISTAPVKSANWWRIFNDTNLTSLINIAYQHNLTLQSAGVRVLQARAQLAQSVGQLYPQQQGLASNYTYNRIGGTQFQNLLPPDFLSTSVGITASWEIDFWGKYRRAIQANNALFLASIAAYDSALVTLTADVARTFVLIRTNEALIRVTETNIHTQAISLQIAKARFKGGQTSLLDVEQATAELAETRAKLPRYISQLQSQKDALALLLGMTPQQISPLLKKGNVPRASATIAVGIPKEVIIRRPDVFQARMEAIAQSATIGVVKANLYPALSLNGNFSFSANTIGDSSLGHLFSAANRTIVAGPAASWSLFNYGQITNAVRVQDATFQRTLLAYMNLVLKVQQEVQDSITRYNENKKAEKALEVANRAAMKSTQLALIRYREGEASYTTVLNTLQQQLRIQSSLVSAQSDTAQAVIALYRALGGGWQMRGQNDVVSQQIKNEMAKRTNWGILLEAKNHLPQTNKRALYLPVW